MPDAIKGKVDYAERAAKAYKEFKQRTQGILVLTLEEKAERYKAFLDAHVDIFDDYFAEAERTRQAKRRDLNGNERLSSDALEMSKDIAALFPRSGTGLYHMQHTEMRGEEWQAHELDQRGRRLLTQEGESKGQSNVPHMERVRSKFESMKRKASTLKFGESAEASAAGPPDIGISPADESRARIEQARQGPPGLRAKERDALITANLAQLQADKAQAQAELTDSDMDKVSAEAAGKEAKTARSNYERVRGELEAARDLAVRDAEGEERRNPLRHRTLRTVDRTDGLTPEQIKGVRDISAFLYRNTLYGGVGGKKDSGYFVDGILRRSPRERLLMYYLIEKKKLQQGKISDAELIEAMVYKPNLDEFKPQMLRAFRGVFGRFTGDSLEWERLSDAAQNTDNLMPRVNRLLTEVPGGPGQGGAPGGGGPVVPLDPALRAAMQRVVAAGRRLLEEPRPSQQMVKDFKDAVQDMYDHLPGEKKSKLEKLDTAKEIGSETSRWLGYVTTPLLLTAGILSKASESAVVQDVSAAFSWDAVPLGSISALASILSLIDTGAGFSKDHSAKQVGRFIKDSVEMLKNCWSSIRGFGNLLGGESWAAAEWAGILGGALSIGGGLLSAIQGMDRLAEEGSERQKHEEYLNRLNNPPANPGMTQEQLEALAEQTDFLVGIAEHGRDSAHRRQVAARFQVATGTMHIFAGGVMFATGGAAAFISAGISGLAFVVGIFGAVTNYVMRNKEKTTVIDRFIGMDDYFEHYLDDQIPEGMTREQYIKAHGGSEAVLKNVLRTFAIRSLGFYSEEKIFSFIMWQYAKALYQGAFLKQDKSVLTADEESDTQHNDERKRRKLYTDLLKNYGFELVYPEPDANPPVVQSPDANAIYKKLLS